MKRFGLLLVILVSSATSWAQFRNNYNQGANRPSRNSDQSELRKFYFGGGLGFGFGSGYNYYSVFPIAGYRVTNDFSVGTGFTYQRYNFTYLSSVAFTQYGFTPFVRYNINPLFVQTELDLISAPAYDANGDLVRALHNRFLVGIGYASNRNTGMGFNIFLAYDLLYTQAETGIYGSPIVTRVFFLF